MTEDREQSAASTGGPVSSPARARGTTEHAQGTSRSSRAVTLGIAILAILLYALIVDAAVETVIGGSPAQWAVVGVVIGYLVLSAVLWRRFSWGTKAAVSLLVLLGVLAVTAWLHDGLTHGVNLLHQSTSIVLGGVTFLTILLAGAIVMRWRFVPLPARLAIGLVAIYGLAAVGWGIATGSPYLGLFHGQGLWKGLPFWLQGGFVGALVFVPLALLVQLGYGLFRLRGPQLRTWGVGALVLSLGVAVAAAGFMGPTSPEQVTTTPPPNPPSKSAQTSEASTVQPPESAQRAQTAQPLPQSTEQQAGAEGARPAVPESTPTQPQSQRTQPVMPTPLQPQAAQPQASPTPGPPAQPEGTGSPQVVPPVTPVQPQVASPTGPTPSPQPAPQPAATPAVPPGPPAPTGGTLGWTAYFSTYGMCSGAPKGKTANIYRVSFTYVVGVKFSLGKLVGVACTNDFIDGLVFAPDGDLLVGGKGNGVHKVNLRTGAFSTIKLPQSVLAFHLMLDPSGTKVWISGIPGQPATMSLPPDGKVTVHTLTGDDSWITTIAWDDAGNAYYTSSGAGGGGSFGRLDLATMTTKRILTGLPAAHGMVFDPYTRNLILMGSKHITQVSVGAAPAIVSDLTAAVEPLDQGTVDGKGHLFAACNCGNLLFVDYSASRKVADPGNFTKTVFLWNDLDDIAPLVGPGVDLAAVSPQDAQVTEEQGRIRIVLESEILFDHDKYNLKPSAEAALTRIKASIIDKYPGARLIVEGHTDDRGSQDYNRALSTRRAQSVATWMTQHGIKASLLQTIGYGKSRPRVPNTNEGNRARNRRVEIVVVK